MDAEESFEEKQEMSSKTSFDVCDFKHIYKPDFKYSFPEKDLRDLFSGIGFGRTVSYDSDESKNLREDINALYQQILSENPAKEKIAIITAGAPGAGKTHLLRQDREQLLRQGKTYAYICPDDVCLLNQTKTYVADIKAGKDKKDCYNKWRPASNAATHFILANLIREKYSFYFGSTSTSPFTYKFFDFLKSQGYRIRLLHVTAPDDLRWKSIQERDKTFVQTTEADVKDKGILLPERINDTFFKYADEIEFYYRDGLK